MNRRTEPGEASPRGSRKGARGSNARAHPGRDATASTDEERLAGLGPLNFLLLGAAVLAIVIGYILLDRGSITAAPVLLVVGYAVLVPAGLLVGSRGS